MAKTAAANWDGSAPIASTAVNQEGKPLAGLLRRGWAEAAIFMGVAAKNACVRAWREIDDLNAWPAF